MRISEIINETAPDYNEQRHIVAILGADISIGNVSNDAEKIFSEYSMNRKNPDSAIRQLSEIEDNIQELMCNEKYWGMVKRNLETEFYTLAEEWLELEIRVQQYISSIKNKHRIK